MSRFDVYHHAGFFYGEHVMRTEMTTKNEPEAQTIPLQQGESFQFRCHSGVSCYLDCCHKLELRLYPYDILCLKEKLLCSSGEFLERYTRLGTGVHPYFPAVMLNMVESDDAPCPFLTEKGCSVYMDRPSACRTYPLERGVEKAGHGAKLQSHYAVVHHGYCKGHDEKNHYTIKQWKRGAIKSAVFSIIRCITAYLSVRVVSLKEKQKVIIRVCRPFI
ncbi:MAG: YkgJ family cysteine cluster protein [Candidatus Electrothrix sp. AU1_5]|nr:YkgJ family cysteine cluster protein [Candidatus Electrothrix gigas]